MVTVLKFLPLFLALFFTCILPSNAEPLKIAVSANFLQPLTLISKKFTEHYQIEVELSSASTGVIYQQIRHGAPFDLFFSADEKRPLLLEQQGLSIEDSRKTYAIGQIALWSVTEDNISLASLTTHDGRIAISAPHLAPYGLAAKQAMVTLNLWSKYHNNSIVGNNVNQTYQFVSTGAVKYGFISYSQLLQSKTGQGVLIDHKLHQPITQQMVILKNGKNRNNAFKFEEFILRKQNQKLIKNLGYLPAKAH